MKTNKRRATPALILLLCALLGLLALAGWLWYDANVDRSGWVEKDGIRFYQDFHAQPVSGWLDIDGGRYYFHEDGTVHTGWQIIGENNYYFDESGVMYTGWQNFGDDTYYFGSDGIMRSGWVDMEGFRYYFPDGVLATGWRTIEGAQYYFRSGGSMHTGWLELEDDRYYLNEDGTMLTGPALIEESSYYFSEDGTLFTGWLTWEDSRRYYLPDGTLATGWQEIDGQRYYLNDEGLMQTGWHQEGEYRYYLQEDGSAAVGPTEIDGAIHYFSPKGIEVILVNAKNPVPDYYEADLVKVVDWHRVDKLCHDALVQMLADCNAAGIEYTFNSAYRTVKEQQQILDLRAKEHKADYNLTTTQAYAKALQTVAVPGTSEHHLGLAVDLLGKEAIAWLTEHCWDYGFIVRYTADKQQITGIINEPWHFRYVGTEISLDMKDSGLCLEEYLGAEPVKG